MKKPFAATAAAMCLMLSAAPAHAAEFFDPIDQNLLDLAGSDFFGATIVDQPGAFSHQFTFTVGSQSSANSSFTTILLGASDIDFTSIFLDGFAFTQTGFDPFAEEWQLAAVSLASGSHTIFVNGSVVGASNNGAYSGGLNVAAVPEPATWAMLLFGFGAIGFGMRRRGAIKRSQQVSFAHA